MSTKRTKRSTWPIWDNRHPECGRRGWKQTLMEMAGVDENDGAVDCGELGF